MKSWHFIFDSVDCDRRLIKLTVTYFSYLTSMKADEYTHLMPI